MTHWLLFLAGTTRVGTPEGYREAETLKMTDKLSKVSKTSSEIPYEAQNM